MASLDGGRTVSISDCVSHVRNRLRTRADGVVFVSAEPGVSYGDFIELVDAVYPDVRIASMMTSKVEMLSRKHLCLALSCWPCAKFPEPSAER